MATFNDPYSSTGRYQTAQSDNPQYYDSTGPAYDPYIQYNTHTDASQAHIHREEAPPAAPTKYEVDEESRPDRQRNIKNAKTVKSQPRISVVPVRKHWSGFDQGEFTPTTPGATRGKGKTARALKEYRYDARGNLWTKGGRGRCIGRFFCCTLMILLLVIISVVLSLALWVRPPAVTIGNVVTQNTTGSLSTTDGLTINLSVDISVNNPNYFGVDFSEIKAEIFYPINNTAVGGGQANDIKFKAHSETNFTFPFALQYKSSNDPGNAVFVDLGTKCGLGGGAKSNINVNYRITLAIRFLVIVVSPVIQNTFSFACPSGILGGGLIPGTKP